MVAPSASDVLTRARQTTLAIRADPRAKQVAILVECNLVLTLNLLCWSSKLPLPSHHRALVRRPDELTSADLPDTGSFVDIARAKLLHLRRRAPSAPRRAIL